MGNEGYYKLVDRDQVSENRRITGSAGYDVLISRLSDMVLQKFIGSTGNRRVSGGLEGYGKVGQEEHDRKCLLRPSGSTAVSMPSLNCIAIIKKHVFSELTT